MAHLNHLGRHFFCIFYTFWFDQKNGQNRKKQFSWKNPFLRFFLWVISVRKGFLYLWWTPIFELARAILLRRVRYQALRMRVFGQKCQKYWFSWKKYFLWFFLWVISDQLAWNKWNKKNIRPHCSSKKGQNCEKWPFWFIYHIY